MKRYETNRQALEELIRGSGVRFRENSRSYVFGCPRCSKPDKLYMLKEDGRFICWTCGESGFRGRPEYALTELLGMPVPQIRKLLYGTPEAQAVLEIQVASRLRDFWGDGDDEDQDAIELTPMGWPLDCYDLGHKFSTKGCAYLESRGIPISLAAEYGIRYCPPQRRVMIPISSQGTLYGWQGRLIVPNEYVDPETGETTKTPKITTTRGLKKEHTLMFLDRLSGSRHAIVCEGPFDALKLHLAGGNVATMGKIVSRAQIELIRNAGVETVYVALDPDAGSEIRKLLSEFSDLRVHLLQPGPGIHDFGEMSLEAALDRFHQAPAFSSGHLVSSRSLGLTRLLSRYGV